MKDPQATEKRLEAIKAEVEKEMAEVDALLSIDSSYTTIHPSQSFEKDLGCFTISLSVPNDEGDGPPLKEIPVVVTSDREVLLVKDLKTFYENHSLLLSSMPAVRNAETRWNPQYIKQFVDGCNPNPPAIYEQLHNIYQRYSEFREDGYYKVFPFWVMGTYLFRVFEAYPYLEISGLKNTGKSKTAELTTRLAFNGINSVGISEASVFRVIEGTRATLSIDEAEGLRDPKRSQGIRELLNAGHRKGAYVYRQEKDKRGNFYTQRFEVYSPKIIASIGGLEDVLVSRAIPVLMVRAKTKIGETIVTDTSEDWDKIRHNLYSWALLNFNDIRKLYEEDPEIRVENNRANDLCIPLLAIGKSVLRDKPEEFRNLKDFLVGKVQESAEMNLDEQSEAILNALNDLVVEDREYTNKEITELTAEYLDIEIEGERKEGGYLQIFPKERKELAATVGYRLKKFGIEKEREGKGVKYPIKRAEVADLIERFLPSLAKTLHNHSQNKTEAEENPVIVGENGN